MPTAIRIENVSKQYRLGQVGTGTITHDLNRWWARIRGKEDPYAVVGQVNRREKAAEGDYVWALKDISLEVEQGEVLGIIGANGSGKSTLLKLISRITSPTTGQIKAKGRIASLLEVGTGMHPEMTARENIYLNGTILGMKRNEIARNFDDIINFAGCRMYVDTPVKRFSSGMKVRLGFAVAAHLRCEVMIVDEVLAVGDAQFQDQCLKKMEDLSVGGDRTILFVSHNLGNVGRLCDRGVVLDHGEMVLIDGIDKCIQHYTAPASTESNHFEFSGNIQKPFCIRRVEFLDQSETPLKAAISGAPLTVRVTAEISDQLYGQNVIMILSIYSNDVLLTSLWSDCISTYLTPRGQTAAFEFQLERCPLTEGQYMLWFMASTTSSILDSIKDVVTLRVYNGDFYGTGKMPKHNKPSVLTEFACRQIGTDERTFANE